MRNYSPGPPADCLGNRTRYVGSPRRASSQPTTYWHFGAPRPAANRCPGERVLSRPSCSDARAPIHRDRIPHHVWVLAAAGIALFDVLVHLSNEKHGGTLKTLQHLKRAMNVPIWVWAVAWQMRRHCCGFSREVWPTPGPTNAVSSSWPRSPFPDSVLFVVVALQKRPLDKLRCDILRVFVDAELLQRLNA